MNFANSVSIVIACLFVLAVTDRVAHTLQVIVSVVFIGVECSLGSSKAFYKGTECDTLDFHFASQFR